MKKASPPIHAEASQSQADITTGTSAAPTAILPFNYQGQSICFNTEGWINATLIARRERRRLDKWLSTDETKAYIEALHRHLNTTEKGDLIQAQRGRSGGTWLHPKLAVFFARWISADFSVWCDVRIDALLSSDPVARRGYGAASHRMEDRTKKASKDGRNLAHFRWDKPGLKREVAHWREKVQLTLGLEDATNDSHQ